MRPGEAGNERGATRGGGGRSGVRRGEAGEAGEARRWGGGKAGGEQRGDAGKRAGHDAGRRGAMAVCGGETGVPTCRGLPFKVPYISLRY